MKYVVFLLSLAFAQSAIAQVPVQNKDLIRQWKELNDYDRDDWIEKLSPETLHELKSGDDASLAVQATWKLMTDSFHLQKGNQDEFTDASQLNYFIGFLEGRANIELPEWWTKTILTSRAIANSAPVVNPSNVESQTTFKLLDRLKSVKDIRVTKNGERYEFEFGGKKFTLSPDMLHMALNGLSRDMDCVLDGKFLYVSVGDSSISSGHLVCCINTEKNMMIWQSKTCAGYSGGLGGASLGYHEMRMFPSNRLFVFDVSHVGFFVHGFDATNGNTIFHFSSMFSR